MDELDGPATPEAEAEQLTGGAEVEAAPETAAAAETAAATAATDAADTLPVAEPTPPTRRRRTRWLAVTAAVLLSAGAVTGVGIGWQAYASARTAVAAQEVEAASDKLTEVTALRETALHKATSSAAQMVGFVGHARPDYLSEATAATLAATQKTLETASAKLTFTKFDPPKVAPRSADLWPWTVVADVKHKQQLTRQENALRRSRQADLTTLNAAQKKFGAAANAVYGELAAHGESILTADTSATYESKIGLRHAIDAGKEDVTSSQFGGPGLLQIVATTDAVTAAQAAGEAAKQDPAYPIRAQIEEYARSIAHGVTLDFEWHAEVSGLGEGWYSGTTMYHGEDGGWATIDLNFPVQDGWSRGDNDAKALITHEVGHSQVVRPECASLFADPVFNYDDEMWATAWAISMGFDTPGAGIEAYGRPTDQQIALAGQCR